MIVCILKSKIQTAIIVLFTRLNGSDSIAERENDVDLNWSCTNRHWNRWGVYMYAILCNGEKNVMEIVGYVMVSRHFTFVGECVSGCAFKL